MDAAPLVTVVTPSLNSARFLEETIRSVIEQDYPKIEYLVIDGGSTDGTLEILERYQGRLECVSQPDGGPAEAVNRGLRRARGTIVAWLASDDTYLPGAVRRAVEAFGAAPEAAVVYGRAAWRDETGGLLGRYPTREPWDARRLEQNCCLCQPACFMRPEALEAVGWLDPRWQSVYDYDLWIRLAKRHPFAAIGADVATARMYPGNRSLSRRRLMFTEGIHLLRLHYGYVPLDWVYGFECYLRDGRDQFFEPRRDSRAAWLRSLGVGLGINYRHPVRFSVEWLRGRI
jgi:glycosyltransferase involved in cell wall biosynthesis